MRIVRQLLAESLLLGGIGGGLGLLLGYAATKGAIRSFPAVVPRTNEISLDGRVLLFTVAVSVGPRCCSACGRRCD